MTEQFKKLGLSEALLRAIGEAKFEKPSTIQEKTIPLALAGKDIIGGSATGSGKTLAFGASIIEKTERGNGLQAIILAPTRELAEQVAMSLRKFSQYKRLIISAVYGGVAISPQIESLAKADIVVGTPGRILDHMERGTINLSKIHTLVLDEADRMLDMGFVHDVLKIVSACPRNRQTFLFSATITPDISYIAQKYMKEPVEVSAESHVDPSKLKQVYYDTPNHLKFSLLVHLLSKEQEGLVMVFCNTRQNVDFIARNLQMAGVESYAIHGGLSQEKRNKTLQTFHAGKTHVLVCTDVAARGLDIKNVSHVYNYDLPKTSKEYVHRIGRTARAGKEGKAISIVSSRDYENMRKILEDESLKLEPEKMPEIQQVRIHLFEREDRGRFDRGDRREGGRSEGRSYGRRSQGPMRRRY